MSRHLTRRRQRWPPWPGLASTKSSARGSSCRSTAERSGDCCPYVVFAYGFDRMTPSSHPARASSVRTRRAHSFAGCVFLLLCPRALDALWLAFRRGALPTVFIRIADEVFRTRTTRGRAQVLSWSSTIPLAANPQPGRWRGLGRHSIRRVDCISLQPEPKWPRLQSFQVQSELTSFC